MAARLEVLSEQLSRRKRLFKREAGPRGLYIYGSVGRGKSMLMDSFFAAAPVPAKRRVHFNAFMLDIHKRLHAEQGRGGDPLPRIASTIAAGARLLCFDEFQVSDVADAMILSRLFTALFERGVTVVATSNVAPGDLYKGGLQRALFLPFIDLLKSRLDVLEIGPGPDHRFNQLRGRPAWFSPDDAEAAARLDELARLAAGDHPWQPTELDVGGRFLKLPRTAGQVVRAGFDELCRQPLGAIDFLALAVQFSVIALDHVPKLPASERNATLRFIILVDQLYEKHALLAATASVHFDALCAEDNAYAFEFRRTASRLAEMQSEDYLLSRAEC